MADDPNKRGKQDRNQISKQKHEIDYAAKRTGMPKPLVEKIQESHGPSREKVIKKLEEMKRNGRK